jgi:rhamnulokinase
MGTMKEDAAYYLAIDVGASNGRHILGCLRGGKLVLEEIHRFSNGPQQRGASLCWDLEQLFRDLVEGIKKCAALGKIPRSIGIDTWGCDYAVLDKTGGLIEPVYCYRDPRTGKFINNPPLPFPELYRITGVANQPFNTLYQLLADRDRLEKAEHLFFISEYFSFRLAGKLTEKGETEYTQASTSMLMDAQRREWACSLIERLDLPRPLFKPLRVPPYDIGDLSRELQREAGFNARVVMIGGHDTASAVSVAGGDELYISSGTWSLLGIQGRAFINDEAREAGYTNEGTCTGGTRFLKNIMGLWILQRLRQEYAGAYSFAALEEMARRAADDPALGPRDADDGTASLVDVHRPVFMSPPSMIEALRDECRRQKRRIPEGPGELAWCVYRSLAQSYKNAVADLKRITGSAYGDLSIIGGGSKDRFLNTLTAEYTGKRVFAGPVEAAAAGNILQQMRHAGDPAVKNGFRELVKRSFDIGEIGG